MPHKLWLVDTAAGSARELKFDGLSGIATDPLASLRKAAKQDALKGQPCRAYRKRWRRQWPVDPLER